MEETMGLFTQYLKAATVAPFFNALQSHLRNGSNFDQCASELRGYFTTQSGKPNGKQLRTYVENMVCFNHAPQTFRTWWHTNYTVQVEQAPRAWVDRELIVTPAKVEERFPAAAEFIQEVGATTVVVDADTTYRSERIGDWSLTVADTEAFIEDSQIACKLGYRDTEYVRGMIERIWPVTNTPVRCRNIQTGKRGRPRKQYLLTRAQALKVVMRSETATADKIQDEIIAVYQMWLDRGKTSAPVVYQSDPTLVLAIGEFREALRSIVASQTEQVSILRSVQAATTTRLDAKIDSVANDLSARIEKLETLPRVTAIKPSSAYQTRTKAAQALGLPHVGPGSLILGHIARGLGLLNMSEMVEKYTIIRAGIETAGYHYSPLAVHAMADATDAAIGAAHVAGWKVDGDGRLRKRRSRATPIRFIPSAMKLAADEVIGRTNAEPVAAE